MKFALFILASWTENDAAHQHRIYEEALEQVQYAEELGFESVWIAEHHSSRYGIFPSLMPILSHIAAQTQTIRLGAGVSVLPFHNPIRLAEEAAMVDVLSNGRLNFGVGRGSADYEYGNFKIDFDSRDTRFQEALDIILGLWTTEDFTYHGQYYQVDGLTIAPKPFQKPHPPVLLGGHAKNVFRRTVEYGDGWMPNRTSPEAIAQGRATLDELCEAAGRDRLPITVYGTPADADLIKQFGDAGADRVVLRLDTADEETALKDLEEKAQAVLA